MVVCYNFYICTLSRLTVPRLQSGREHGARRLVYRGKTISAKRPAQTWARPATPAPTLHNQGRLLPCRSRTCQLLDQSHHLQRHVYDAIGIAEVSMNSVARCIQVMDGGRGYWCSAPGDGQRSSYIIKKACRAFYIPTYDCCLTRPIDCKTISDAIDVERTSVYT